MNRKDLEKNALKRIAYLNDLRQFEKTADQIISRHNGEVKPEDLTHVVYESMTKRYFLYFCAMDKKNQAKAIEMMVDRLSDDDKMKLAIQIINHVMPASPGDLIDGHA